MESSLNQLGASASWGATGWLLFGIIILFFLWLDLKSHKDSKEISAWNAGLWTMVWIGLSACFAGYIYYTRGSEDATLFVAAYLLEKGLAIDNLFVISAVITTFGISGVFAHRILHWGIMGALVFRGLIIGFGAALLQMSDAVIGVLGVLVLFSAWAMWRSSEDSDVDPRDHWAVRWIGKIKFLPPVADWETGKSFVVRNKGKLYITVGFLAVFYIELLDVAFAFDSIPAIFGITQDLFLIYTSNIFAILGLRQMYFLLAAAEDYLSRLETAVVLILVFIGVKMLLTLVGIHVPVMVSLAVVAGGLVGGVLWSFIDPVADDEEEEQKV